VAYLDELGPQRELRDHGEQVLARPVALSFGTDHDTETLPSGEGRDDGGADPNLLPQTLGYPVAQGRQGVRRNEQAHPHRVRQAGGMGGQLARAL
jgi:hypothetical protein